MRSLAIADQHTVWSVPLDRLGAALSTRPLVVLLHGYGSHERDLAGLVPHLPAEPVYASIRAPLPAPFPDGFAWWPIVDLGQPDLAIVTAATRGVLAWIEGVQARVRTPGPLGLLGFSQGGAMVTQLMRHQAESFACGVVLSGFCVGGQVAGDEALEQIRPPVFWGRDDADPVIPRAAVEYTEQVLPVRSTLTTRRYRGIGHGIGEDEIRDVGEFLTANLGT